MSTKLITLSLTLLLGLIVASTSSCSTKNSDRIFKPNQTSARFLVKQAEKAIEEAEPHEKNIAIKKHLLVYDIYIKARSYAILNKLFFWIAILAGISVLLWPSVAIIFAGKSEKWQWIKSATVQTTVTAIAALTFSFYAQYKDKQAYAESLMRHVIYSEESIATLSAKVSEELARIDKGFSFNSIFSEKENKKSG